MESTVFPFIVRDATLLGVDTVRTPIDERRRVWGGMAAAFPPELVESMVRETVGLDGLAAALERILAGGARGRTLVRPGR